MKGGGLIMNVNWKGLAKGVGKLALPVAGLAATLFSSYLEEKKLNEKLDKKVAEALAKSAQKEV